MNQRKNQDEMRCSRDLENCLETAILNRSGFFASMHREDTNCYRVFHGVVEGLPGLTIDRFGTVVLVQTHREELPDGALKLIEEMLDASLDESLHVVWNHRGARRREVFEELHPVRLPARLDGSEIGLVYDVNPRHRGIDPLLFPDFRAGRRRLMREASGASVLNLFAYTCGAGVVAAHGGAREVWNVDFSDSALRVGIGNARRNRIDEGMFRIIREDVIPTIRQLAGMAVRGRGAKRRYQRFEARQFDLVVLDPPRWARSPFGAVDLVRDYQSLFKPALLATRLGGRMLVTNNVAAVECDAWLESLQRCAIKAGRPISTIEVIPPEEDFPSFDGRHPLKIAWLEV